MTERQYGGLDRDDAHEHQDEMDAAEAARQEREASDTPGKLNLLLHWGEIDMEEYMRRNRQLNDRGVL